MKGRFSLEIESRRVIYQLNLERKVTVIKGNSGTGKTSMIRILSDYAELGKDSGVHVRKSSDYHIKIFENRTDWHQELEQAHNSIIFVDEDVRYLYEKKISIPVSNRGLLYCNHFPKRNVSAASLCNQQRV